MAEHKQILDNLFRTESGKLIAVLTRIFGTQNLELTEDVVQDTLLKALQNWSINGIPENPSAWLFTVARNKALDAIRHARHYKDFAREISPLLMSEYSAGETLRELVHDDGIEDEQLRMMFVCCHPAIAQEAQVAMILKTLCGFSVTEIAKAFFSNDETIGKRLYRARQQFREEKIAFSIPSGEEILPRTSNVLLALYLLFNEGYNSTHHLSAIRDDLVEESLRLGKMLADHPATRGSESLALMALFCFQAARLHGRIDEQGDLISLRDQNRNLWNQELIEQGRAYLNRASTGDHATAYHIEAAIAFEHCSSKTFDETNWTKITFLYNWLYLFKPDPLVALNRLIALSEVQGPEVALRECQHLPDSEALKNYALYPAAMGECSLRLNDFKKARHYFEQAIALTKSPAEKRLFEKKLASALIS